MPTLEEVGHGRSDTDPLLGSSNGGRQGSEVSRHNHQQRNGSSASHQQLLQQPQGRGSSSSSRAAQDPHTSGSSSITSSYHHHTGDSGMSAGPASIEQASSMRSDVGPLMLANGNAVRLGNGLVDDKFVGTLSPPHSHVSVQSGYNSTASSCWQYQRPLPPPQPPVQSKSWHGSKYSHALPGGAEKGFAGEFPGENAISS